MARPKSDNPTEPVMVRMTPDLIKRIDEFRRGVDDLPSRAEMIRRILMGWLDEHEQS